MINFYTFYSFRGLVYKLARQWFFVRQFANDGLKSAKSVNRILKRSLHE